MAEFISTETNGEVIYLQETGHRVYRKDGAWLHSDHCKQCAAEHSLHPTSGTLRDLQAVSTPQPLASSQALSTPPTCG